MTTMVLTPAFPRLPRVDGAVVRQLVRYGVVGVLGTAVSALLYLLFRVWWDAVPANLAALVLSTVASTEANRRFTFRGVPTDRVREYLQNAATVAFYAVYSSAVLLLLDALVDDPTALQESVTIAAASVLGGLARFAVLRNWVFGDESRHGGRAKIGQSGAMIRLLPTRRLLAAAAALGGLLLSTAASCGPGTPSVPRPPPSRPWPRASLRANRATTTAVGGVAGTTAAGTAVAAAAAPERARGAPATAERHVRPRVGTFAVATSARSPPRVAAPRTPRSAPGGSAAGGSGAMPLSRHLPRPAIVLLTGVLAGLVAAGVVVAVRPSAAPPAPAVPLSATAAPTSPADAPDPCASAVAALAPRDRLAQRLVVGVDAADPAAVVDTVRATQVGGIFIGGNATALLRDHALNGCRRSPGPRSRSPSTTRAVGSNGSTASTGSYPAHAEWPRAAPPTRSASSRGSGGRSSRRAA